MKKLIIVFVSVIISSLSFSQIEGRWKTIDESTGKARSEVEFYMKKDGLYYGKIVALHEEIPSPVCLKCPGDLKNQPIIGLEIFRELKKEKGKWVGGTVVDPESGKTYKCKAEINKNGDLDLRGYLGFSLLGRTQTWVR